MKTHPSKSSQNLVTAPEFSSRAIRRLNRGAAVFGTILLAAALLLSGIDRAQGQDPLVIDDNGKVTVNGPMTAGTVTVNGPLTATKVIDATKGVDGLTAIQIPDLDASKITGVFKDTQIPALNASKITGTLPVNRGGTGSTTKNFVDLASNQYIRGTKLFTGKVGIGTNNAIAPLHVKGGTFTPFTQRVWGSDGDYAWTYQNTREVNQGGKKDYDKYSPLGPLSHSIVAEQGIRCSRIDLVSDGRIKNIIGQSNAAADLDTLAGIEITDYTFKDVIGNGTGAQKRVIAQQVEKVYPEAVTRSIGVVPDIYEKSTIRDGWVALATDLKKGERVRLIGNESDEIHEVLEVRGGAFRTAFQPVTERVFVYGRQVNDFRSVDYDAIAMLNVSATQQIKKEKDAEVAALQDENTALRTLLEAQANRLSALEARDRARDAKLTAIEERLTAIANPSPALAVSLKDGGGVD